MRQKKSTEQIIAEDVKSFADALGVSEELLKQINVSLYDIIAVRQNKEASNAFASARSVWRAAIFYVVKILLINLNSIKSGSVEAE